MATRVLLGAVVGAHGLKGEVKVKTFTERPENLAAYGRLTTEDGRALSLAGMRAVKDADVIARFSEVGTREAADSLKGQGLYVERTALPEPEAREYYLSDLVGLRAEDEMGAAIGTVAGFHNFGAGDLIEIELANGGSELVPFTDQFVPVVDIAAGRVVAHLPRDEEQN